MPDFRTAFMPLARVVWTSGLAALLAAGAGGCGKETPSNVGRVSGKVTLAGQPLPEALVSFAPTNPGGSTSLGRTKADGTYTLNYSQGIDGAEIGENQVRISTYSGGNPDGDPPRPAVPEKVPAIYNSQTTLKVEVKAGENTHDFSLDPGPVVQPSDTEPVSGRRARSDGC